MRIRFLPAFFASLAIIVAVIAYVRIRSYEAMPPAAVVAASRSEPEVTQTIEAVPDASSPAPLTQTTSRMRIVETTTSALPAALTWSAAAKPPLSAPVTSTAAAPVPPTQSGGSATALLKPPAPPTQIPAAPPKQQPPPEKKEEEKDLSSDNVPPRLVSIEFVPPQVQDGQETVLKIEAVDELAGVRSISGTILAPSGTVQGFACVREGESNRYVSRVLVPKTAADGIWRVNYLAMTDQANNTAALSLANGMVPPTATFRVISPDADDHGPTLRAVWLDHRSMRSGEKNMVMVQADDDKSGLHLISGVFQSPSRVARIGFICKARDATTWECEIAAPPCADCGDWRLEQLQLQDKANNMTTVRADNQLVAPVRLDISSEQCDATPPAIESVTFDKKAVSNVTPSIVLVTAMLGDDVCGIQSMSGQVMGPTGPEGAPSTSFSFAQGRDARTWIGRFTIPRLAAKGTWRITWLQVLDKGRNLRTYAHSDPVLQEATVLVE